MSVVTPVFTGLGLFFVGARFMATNLSAMASGSARSLIRRALGSRLSASISGVFAGLLTQNTNSVALIMVSLARSGVAVGPRAALVPVWSNVGASALVILVALDTSFAAAVLVLMAGIALYFDLRLSDQWRHGILAALGAALLLFGIEALKASSEPLRNLMMVNGILQPGTNAWMLLIVGVAMALGTQSSAVASAMAVALAGAGLFNIEMSVLLVVGANGGSGLNYAFLGRRGESNGRHIMLFQAAQKFFGMIVLLLPLLIAPLFVEQFLAVPHLKSGGLLAWAFLCMQLFGSLCCTLLEGPLYALFVRIAPSTNEEGLAIPAFLIDEALKDTALAVELAEREVARLAERLPLMLENIREGGDNSAPSSEVLLSANSVVSAEIRRYLADMMNCQPDRATLIQSMRQQQALTNVMFMSEALGEFARAFKIVIAAKSDHSAVSRMLESLHMLLEVLSDASKSGDPDEREMAMMLFGKRGELMEDIRRNITVGSDDIASEVLEAQFHTTILFERILWLGGESLQALARQNVGTKEAAIST